MESSTNKEDTQKCSIAPSDQSIGTSISHTNAFIYDHYKLAACQKIHFLAQVPLFKVVYLMHT